MSKNRTIPFGYMMKSCTDLMTEFDEVMFISIVERIVVKDKNTLEFNLYGGLRFHEKI